MDHRPGRDINGWPSARFAARNHQISALVDSRGHPIDFAPLPDWEHDLKSADSRINNNSFGVHRGQAPYVDCTPRNSEGGIPS